MGKIDRIFASELNAAKLFDLRITEFRELVKAGHLPPGREIAPGLVRWHVEQIHRIASGTEIDTCGDIKW